MNGQQRAETLEETPIGACFPLEEWTLPLRSWTDGSPNRVLRGNNFGATREMQEENFEAKEEIKGHVMKLEAEKESLQHGVSRLRDLQRKINATNRQSGILGKDFNATHRQTGKNFPKRTFHSGEERTAPLHTWENGKPHYGIHKFTTGRQKYE